MGSANQIASSEILCNFSPENELYNTITYVSKFTVEDVSATTSKSSDIDS